MTRPGMRVGVLGVGGLGHLALQFAARMGADVTALDVAPDKAREGGGEGMKGAGQGRAAWG